VMFLFLNDVVTSARRASPRFTALEVKAYRTAQHIHMMSTLKNCYDKKKCEANVQVYILFPFPIKLCSFA
jgi:hypothetical protein